MILVHGYVQRGLTALHDACTEGHTHIALLLLAMGADVAAKTKDGWTCLMCACSNGHTQLAQLLYAAGCDFNLSTKVQQIKVTVVLLSDSFGLVASIAGVLVW